MLEVALGLFVVVLGLLYYYLTSTFSHWKDKGVNFIKPYPLVGSVSIGQKSHASLFFQKVYQKFDNDPFVGFFLALRKYPPVINIVRVCTKKYVIPGKKVSIDEGTRVMMPIFAMQRDPKFFPDPENFDPERFSDEKQKTSSQYVYMPFGEGPRCCIGIRFARMQTSLGLASVLRRFEIRSSSKMEYPVTFDPRQSFLVSKQNITVRATRV